MTDDLLKDALHGIADRATRPDALAERALRQAHRRRGTRLAAATGGTALAVAAPFVLLNGGAPDDVTTPATTPSVTRYVPTTTVAPKLCGAGDDYRELVSSKTHSGQTLVLLGKPGDTPGAFPWLPCILDGLGPSPRFTPMTKATVNENEAIRAFVIQTQDLKRPKQRHKATVRQVFGMASPDVERIIIKIIYGKKGAKDSFLLSSEATIKDGFFIGGHFAPKQSMRLHQAKVEVVAYDAAGKRIHGITIN